MAFLKLKSKFPAMMFSFFSLTVTSNFLTRGNKAKQIQNYVIPVSIYLFPGFYFFHKNS